MCSAAVGSAAAARLRLFTHSPISHLVEIQTFLGVLAMMVGRVDGGGGGDDDVDGYDDDDIRTR